MKKKNKAFILTLIIISSTLAIIGLFFPTVTRLMHLFAVAPFYIVFLYFVNMEKIIKKEKNEQFVLATYIKEHPDMVFMFMALLMLTIKMLLPDAFQIAKDGLQISVSCSIILAVLVKKRNRNSSNNEETV